MFAENECYLKGINRRIGDNMFAIYAHAPISVGFSFTGY